MFSVDAVCFSITSFLWLLKSTDVGCDPEGWRVSSVAQSGDVRPHYNGWKFQYLSVPNFKMCLIINAEKDYSCFKQDVP